MKVKVCNNACGSAWCCTKLMITIANPSELVVYYLRNCDLYKYRGKDNKIYYVAIFDLPCKYLKKNKCSIHSKKPKVCKYFPRMYRKFWHILPKDCPYSKQFNVSVLELSFKKLTDKEIAKFIERY